MIDLWAVGGYSEIGGNLTAVRVEDEVIICDMGVWMDKLVSNDEDDPMNELSTDELISAQIIPDDRELYEEWGDKVKAIVISHAHLDHVGAVRKLADKYDCPIFMTPFTSEVLKQTCNEEENPPGNEFIPLNPGSTYDLTDNITLEFVYATHSTPQTVILAIKTETDGNIVYANDWKFDEYPPLGKRTDYDSLKRLGSEGVKLFVSDTTRIDQEERTYSESIVREMLRDILWWTENKKDALFLTTFASHISRINTVIDLAEEIDRKVILIGRSLKNYAKAAKKAGIIDLFKRTEDVVSYSDEVEEAMQRVQNNREKYFVICTGCQGEPNAVLTRIADGRIDFDFLPEDQVIYSSSTIPTPIIKAQRKLQERNLREAGVRRIFKDVHVSGHASREDHRDMLNMLEPDNYIPCHGGVKKLAEAVDLASELGYTLGEDVYILQDKQRRKIE